MQHASRLQGEKAPGRLKEPRNFLCSRKAVAHGEVTGGGGEMIKVFQVHPLLEAHL